MLQDSAPRFLVGSHPWPTLSFQNLLKIFVIHPCPNSSLQVSTICQIFPKLNLRVCTTYVSRRRPPEQRKVPHPRHLLEWVLAAQVGITPQKVSASFLQFRNHPTNGCSQSYPIQISHLYYISLFKLSAKHAPLSHNWYIRLFGYLFFSVLIINIYFYFLVSIARL